MHRRAVHRFTRLALFTVTMAVISAARADQALLSRIIDPNVSYSADLSSSSHDTSVTGRIYHRPGATRVEYDIKETPTVTLIDSIRRRGWIMTTRSRLYIEIPFELDVIAVFLPTARVPRDQIKLTRVGRDTVDGIPTSKIRMQHPLGRAVMWVTADGIVLKMDGVSTAGGKRTRSTMRLRNLRRGPQAAALFVLPAGYRKLEVPRRR